MSLLDLLTGNNNDDDSDDSSGGNFNYNTATMQNQLLQALAARNMTAQNPYPANMTVPGGPSGFVVPNKFGSISSGLQNVLGAYMANKAINNSGQIQNRANQALESTLGDMNTPTVGQTANPNMSTDTAAASTPAALNSQANNPNTLSPVGVSAPYLGLRSKTMPENLPDILQLEQEGPLGQALAGKMLSPHPLQMVTDKAGNIHVMDTLTGQEINQVAGQQGPSVLAPGASLVQPNTNGGPATTLAQNNGVDARGRATMLQQFNNLGSFNDPTNLAAGTNFARTLGYIGVNDTATPQQLEGFRDRATTEFQNQQSQLQAQAYASRTNANTSQQNVVGGILADRGKIQASNANLTKMDQQLAEAQGILASGVPSGWNADAQLAFGKVSGGAQKLQRLDQILNDTRLSGITQDLAGSGGRTGAALFNAYTNHSMTTSMNTQDLAQGIRMMRQSIHDQLTAGQGTASGYNSALSRLGYQDAPSSSTPSSSGGFNIPGQ